MTARTEANNTLRVIANQVGIPANQSQPYSLYISWYNGKGKVAYLNADKNERFLFNDRRAGTAKELHFLLLSIDDMPSMVEAIREELRKNAQQFLQKFVQNLSDKYKVFVNTYYGALNCVQFSDKLNAEEREEILRIESYISALTKNNT